MCLSYRIPHEVVAAQQGDFICAGILKPWGANIGTTPFAQCAP